MRCLDVAGGGGWPSGQARPAAQRAAWGASGRVENVYGPETKKPPYGGQFKSGADTENRTRDLTLTKGALYQLSHISTQKYSLAMTYSHTIVRCTTIGVTAFHFCVRNGDRWDYSTMVARQICI